MCVCVCAYRVGRPPCIPLTALVMRDNAAYLLDNGRILVLWLGRNIPQPFLQQVRSHLIQYTFPVLSPSALTGGSPDTD